MTASLQSPSCTTTHAATTVASSQSTSPSSQNSQLETPFAPARVTTANRSLLVRVLNKNLAQQREEANMQSLSSDPLLTSLPAGKDPHSQLTSSADKSRTFWDQLKAVLFVAVPFLVCCHSNSCCTCRISIIISQHRNSANGC